MVDGRGPASGDEPDPTAAVERARRGVREWVAQAGHRVRAGTPYGILAFLAASAVAPVVGAGLGASGEIAVALGQIGGIGNEYLAHVLIGAARRARRGGHGPDAEQWRDAVAEALEPLLSGQDEQARGLRTEVGEILRTVDALGVAVDESTQATTEVRHQLAQAVGALAGGSAELRWMLADALRMLGQLQAEFAVRGGEQRQQIDLVRQSLVSIAQLRRDVLAAQAAPDPGTDLEEIASPEPAEAASPYPGLASFQPEDAAWFCGREDLVAQVLGRMAEQLAGAGPLLLVGVSGAGKSSLLRAGVLPAVADGALDPGSGGRKAGHAGAWPWLLFTPGDRPLTELASRTAALAGVPALEAMRAMQADPGGFGGLAEQAAPAGPDGSGRLVIVVDQFEEVFTQGADPAERTAFVTALTNAGPALVVLAVRADFYAECAGLPPLAGLLAAGPLVVGRMSTDELRRAVLVPAGRAGLSVEPGLVELLLADLGVDAAGGYDPGALPLLAHALRAAWEQRAGSRLTVAGYQRAGGIRHAIAETAERIYLDLDADGRDRLHDALLRLVTVTDGRPVARRRAGRAGLAPDLLGRLVAERLVTAGDETVEISHEALLTNWPRLADWLAESGSQILLRQRLEEATQAWSEAGEDPDLLYRGGLLTAAREWAATGPDLGTQEQRFLEASTVAAEAAEAARARTTRRLRRQVAGLATTLVLALVATAVAGWQIARVRQQAAQVHSRQYAAQSLAAGVNGQQARRLALDAWQQSHTVEARGALLSAPMSNLIGHLGTRLGGTTVAVDAAGTRVAVGRGDGTLELWDATTLRQIGSTTSTGIASQVVSADFSPNGKWLATGTSVGTVAESAHGTVLWNAVSGQRLRTLPGVGLVAWRPRADQLINIYLDTHLSTFAIGEWDPNTGRRLAVVPMRTSALPFGLAVSPDGSLVAVSGTDGVTRIWRLSDGRLLTSVGTAHPKRPADAVFAADGDLVTSDYDGTVHAWAIPSGRLLRNLFSHTVRAAGRLAATPVGLVYVAGSGSTVESWYEPSGEPTNSDLTGFDGTIQRVAVSADSALTAATGTDGVTTLWRRGESLQHQAAVLTVSFDPTGRLIATGDADGLLRIWNADTGALVASHQYPGMVQDVAYAPDGTLAVAFADGTVHLRDPGGPDRKIITLGGGLVPSDVRFSPGGDLLAVGGYTGPPANDHGVVVVWDVRRKQERERLDTGTEEPFALTFSARGDLLIAGTTEWTIRPDDTFRKQSIVRTWRTSDLSVVGSYSAGEDQVSSIAASPDGQVLAVAGTNGEVQFRRIGDGSLTGVAIHDVATVRAAAYSPDGRTVATVTTADYHVRLWDAQTGRLLAALSGHSSDANAVAFSPDGRSIASADSDTTVAVWQIQPADAISRICQQLRAVQSDGAGLPTACAVAGK